MRRGAKPLICFLSRWNASSHSRLRFSTQTETDNCYARVKKVSSIQPDLRVAGRWCSQCRKTAWWRRRPRRGLPVPHGESGLASPAGTLVRTSHLTSSQLRHNGNSPKIMIETSHARVLLETIPLGHWRETPVAHKTGHRPFTKNKHHSSVTNKHHSSITNKHHSSTKNKHHSSVTNKYHSSTKNKHDLPMKNRHHFPTNNTH